MVDYIFTISDSDMSPMSKSNARKSLLLYTGLINPNSKSLARGSILRYIYRACCAISIKSEDLFMGGSSYNGNASL